MEATESRLRSVWRLSRIHIQNLSVNKIPCSVVVQSLNKLRQVSDD